MAKSGEYQVNENVKTDSSFKSFICALLVFLAICAIFGTILYFVGNKRKNEDDANSKGATDELHGMKTTIRPIAANTTVKSSTLENKPTTNGVKTQNKGSHNALSSTTQMTDDSENVTEHVWNINENESHGMVGEKDLVDTIANINNDNKNEKIISKDNINDTVNDTTTENNVTSYEENQNEFDSLEQIDSKEDDKESNTTPLAAITTTKHIETTTIKTNITMQITPKEHESSKLDTDQNNQARVTSVVGDTSTTPIAIDNNVTVTTPNNIDNINDTVNDTKTENSVISDEEDQNYEFDSLEQNDSKEDNDDSNTTPLTAITTTKKIATTIIKRTITPKEHESTKLDNDKNNQAKVTSVVDDSSTTPISTYNTTVTTRINIDNIDDINDTVNDTTTENNVTSNEEDQNEFDSLEQIDSKEDNDDSNTTPLTAITTTTKIKTTTIKRNITPKEHESTKLDTDQNNQARVTSVIDDTSTTPIVIDNNVTVTTPNNIDNINDTVNDTTTENNVTSDEEDQNYEFESLEQTDNKEDNDYSKTTLWSAIITTKNQARATSFVDDTSTTPIAIDNTTVTTPINIDNITFTTTTFDSAIILSLGVDFISTTPIIIDNTTVTTPENIDSTTITRRALGPHLVPIQTTIQSDTSDNESIATSTVSGKTDALQIVTGNDSLTALNEEIPLTSFPKISKTNLSTTTQTPIVNTNTNFNASTMPEISSESKYSTIDHPLFHLGEESTTTVNVTENVTENFKDVDEETKYTTSTVRHETSENTPLTTENNKLTTSLTGKTNSYIKPLATSTISSSSEIIMINSSPTTQKYTSEERTDFDKDTYEILDLETTTVKQLNVDPVIHNIVLTSSLSPSPTTTTETTIRPATTYYTRGNFPQIGSRLRQDPITLKSNEMNTDGTTERATDATEYPLLTTFASQLVMEPERITSSSSLVINSNNYYPTTDKDYSVEEKHVKSRESTSVKNVEVTNSIILKEYVDPLHNVETTTLSPRSITIPAETKNSAQHFPTLVPVKVTPNNQNNIITTKKPISTCTSVYCQHTASRMLHMMNPAADPCEDFYEFACGSSDNIEDSGRNKKLDEMFAFLETINSGSPKYFRDFRTFYNSCVHHEEVYSYSYRLKSILTLNVGEDINELLSEMILQQTMPFFDVGIDFILDSSKYILQLSIPGLSTLKNQIADWNLRNKIKNLCLQQFNSAVTSSSINLTAIHVEYEQCQLSTWEIKLKNFMKETDYFWQNNLVSWDLNATVEDVINLFRKISLVIPSEYDLREDYVNKIYETKTIKELDNEFPLLDWQHFLSRLHGMNIHVPDVVQVYFKKYLDTLFSIFEQMDKKNLLDQLTIIHWLTLYENTVESKGNLNRHTYCMDLTTQLMPDVVTNVYKLSNDFHAHDQQNIKISQLFQNYLIQFNVSLNNSTLDSNCIEVFQKKLTKISLSLVSRADIKVFQKMSESNYKNLNLSSSEFLFNTLEVFRNYRINVYSLIHTPLRDSMTVWGYFVSPFDDEPKAFYNNDFIAVPPGILKYSTKSSPLYPDLIQAGLPIARELGRFFDPVGRKHIHGIDRSTDKYYEYLVSNMRNIMTFTNHRVVDGKNMTYQIYGGLSTNERISDNTGLRLVYDNFVLKNDYIKLPWITEKYSEEQIFFIAAAQGYCKKTSVTEFMQKTYESETLPAMLRVENIVINSKHFADAFQCGTGSGMNPEMKLQFPFVKLESTDYYDYTNNDVGELGLMSN